ncbi:putative SAP1 [Coleophoma cylindrospora]|uniref:Putative SAP1 n=1 Tax=Coleophoma cylindrospora TaxID=1849047 RepID=A0A3D8RT61_9HELO|nr:putative SAP1 [Coleophoma cylindrospora]
MRNKSSSALQKTYDDCYLICSTAVYFEGQGNEAEALRSWRSALDQIYYHNAYKVPAGYVPKSETEKALKDSLRDMEMQCKERVDLLEALRISRQEGDTADKDDLSSKLSKVLPKLSTPRASSDGEHVEKGWIGNGTIPAVSYPELSRPPLPPRPSLLSKHSSEIAVVGRRASSNTSYIPSSSNLTASKSSSSLVPPASNTSRSPSPDKKRSMKMTLRSSDKKSSRSPRVSSSRPVPNKAASLAWQSINKSSKDKLGRSLDAEHDSSSTALDAGARKSSFDPNLRSASPAQLRYDSRTRTLVPDITPRSPSPTDLLTGWTSSIDSSGRSNAYPFPSTDSPQPSATLSPSASNELLDVEPTSSSEPNTSRHKKAPPTPPPHSKPTKLEPLQYPTYLKEYPETTAKKNRAESELPLRRKPAEASTTSVRLGRKPVANSSSPRNRDRHMEKDVERQRVRRESRKSMEEDTSMDEDTNSSSGKAAKLRRKQKQKEAPILADPTTPTSDDSQESMTDVAKSAWGKKVAHLMKNLPKGVDEQAAKQIFNEIVVQGDEVHWDDVAGLDIAKKALKEAVVYPFLRPDLFMGLREPARGMLLFGPPGTGKTMLARAVATESRSTFFSISASSLTSKYLGESEKLVRALFSLAKALAPSIIFVDEIDSLLSSRSGSGEHEATRRIKTEFLIQWSDLQRAAAGREQSEKEKERGDASRVLVLAATNLPWAIDEAARRRFVRRQYIPLPEDETRAVQLRTLLGHQKHSLSEEDIQKLVALTDGFSGSDITALAKDAAMGPLRSLGEALLHMSMDEIRPIQYEDFEASLINIRPSVSKQGLKEFEDWAREFGERGG